MDDKNMNKNDEQLDTIADTQLENEVNKNDTLEVQQPADDYKEKYVRLLAEFNNFQKQKDQELKAMAQYGTRNILLKVIDIVDDIEMGLGQESISEETQNILTILKSKLEHTLTLEGVEEIAMNQGDALNPSEAEVLSTIDDEKNKGKIAHIVRKGYKIGDRVIRSAKVVVGK